MELKETIIGEINQLEDEITKVVFKTYDLTQSLKTSEDKQSIRRLIREKWMRFIMLNNKKEEFEYLLQ